MTTDEKQLRLLFSRLQNSLDVGVSCVELGEMRDVGNYVEPGLKDGEMALGDFIIRGRFKSLKALMGQE